MKNKKIGFTVVELLTVIAIIMIFALGVSNFNFRAISDKQNLEVLLNSVISQIETVRTNALIGKGILPESGTELVVPKFWKIEFSKDDGTIITRYKIVDNSNWIEYDITEVDQFTSIPKIFCTGDDIYGEESGIIIFEGNKYSLYDNTKKLDGQEEDNPCLETKNIISIEIQYKNFIETIKFNAINGLVEKVKS